MTRYLETSYHLLCLNSVPGKQTHNSVCVCVCVRVCVCVCIVCIQTQVSLCQAKNPIKVYV